jgi:hypothetical protein
MRLDLRARDAGLIGIHAAFLAFHSLIRSSSQTRHCVLSVATRFALAR